MEICAIANLSMWRKVQKKGTDESQRKGENDRGEEK